MQCRLIYLASDTWIVRWGTEALWTQLERNQTRTATKRITRSIVDEMPYRQRSYAVEKRSVVDGKMRLLADSVRKDL